MSGVSAAWCPQQRSRLMPSRTHSRAVSTHAKQHAQQQLARDLEVECAAMGQRCRPQSSGPGLLCAGTYTKFPFPFPFDEIHRRLRVFTLGRSLSA